MAGPGLDDQTDTLTGPTVATDQETGDTMNYTIVRRWTDGAGVRWFTVAWPGGRQSTHCVSVA